MLLLVLDMELGELHLVLDKELVELLLVWDRDLVELPLELEQLLEGLLLKQVKQLEELSLAGLNAEFVLKQEFLVIIVITPEMNNGHVNFFFSLSCILHIESILYKFLAT